MLWFILALLTGAALLFVLWPLRAARRDNQRPAAEAAFLRRQLADVETEIAQGVAAAGSGETARAEIGRRLLAALKRQDEVAIAVTTQAASARRRQIAALAIVLVLPALTFGLYERLGAPDFVQLSDTAKPPATGQDADILALVAKVEAHLAAHPDDGKGYAVVAPIYMRMARFDEAARALAAAIRLSGSTADRQADYGEALFGLAGTVVDAEARAAFDSAVALNPKQPKARFYLALAAEQEGDASKAERLWSALIAEAPPDAPWLTMVREHLASLGAPAASPGPAANPQAAKDIAALPPAERQAFIRQMVEGLAARLAQDGHDLAGWQKLVRAYAVLEEPAKAREALRAARAALGADAAAAATLDTLARDLGLDKGSDG